MDLIGLSHGIETLCLKRSWWLLVRFMLLSKFIDHNVLGN